ncbi:toxin [Brevibacterium litoralis]|uniref:toxin n=1 Tax=Brevibacterium litoralis TaxID=3138935 RepID=UPI0032EF23ED
MSPDESAGSVEGISLHRAARKHYRRDRLSDDAVLDAADHVLRRWPLDDEDDPLRWLMLGVDRSGRVLELVALVFDDGHILLIHAMKARPQYLEHL